MSQAVSGACARGLFTFASSACHRLEGFVVVYGCNPLNLVGTGFLEQHQELDRLSQGPDVRNGSPSMMCAEEKDGAINDRIAWLERVINDRNMEVSLAGAPEPDKADMPCVDRPGVYSDPAPYPCVLMSGSSR